MFWRKQLWKLLFTWNRLLQCPRPNICPRRFPPRRGKRNFSSHLKLQSILLILKNVFSPARGRYRENDMLAVPQKSPYRSHGSACTFFTCPRGNWSRILQPCPKQGEKEVFCNALMVVSCDAKTKTGGEIFEEEEGGR